MRKPFVSKRFLSIVALLTATPLSLTSCSANEDTKSEETDESTFESQDEFQSQHSPTDEIAAPHNSSGISITGDYKTDLRAVGFEPEDHVFNSVIGTLEDSVCEFDSSQISRIAHESMITAMVQDSNVGPDTVRVIAEYNCPLEAELIEELIQTAE